jgi:hypothetical protein
MSLDGLVLGLQRLIDRFSRWLRLRSTTPVRARRFLIVQIDGLSRAVLERGLEAGRLPGLASLLASGRLRMRPLSVGIPSSTPAFQAALMYGVYPDIPGFHYYDKREGVERYFPRPGVADLVEERHARGRQGIMEGGACYGCVFTGGATDNLWTMAKLLRPSRAGVALLRVPLSSVLLGWVVLKCCALTLVELTRDLLRLVADPLSEQRPGTRWLLLKIGLSIWMRQLFTLATSSDLYRGAPAVYVNYLEYDVFAHAFGPEHAYAVRALGRVDRSIRQLVRILRRLPEMGYDLYVLSDHGQVTSRPFTSVSGGVSIAEAVRAAFGASGAGPAVPDQIPLRAQVATYRRARWPGLIQRFLTYLERDFARWIGLAGAPPTVDGLHVVAAGPNAFVYATETADPLTAEDIEGRWPGAATVLSRHPGVGFVLARSARGPVCWYRGERISLAPGSDGGPFRGRRDREVVLTGLRELMAMPSAGDLVVYGIGAAGGDVSFLDERGAHAGPAEAELQTFVLHPRSVRLPAEALTHPVQLYPHFIAYRKARS